MSIRYQYDLELATKIAKQAYLWCVDNLGTPKNAKPCKIRVDKTMYQKYKGYYCDGKMIVYLKICKSYSDVIRTVIHEYIHYLQLRNDSQYVKYHKYSKLLGYNNNPYELEARMGEKLHYQSCWYTIKKSCKELSNVRKCSNI
jgi:hypothetical protein